MLRKRAKTSYAEEEFTDILSTSNWKQNMTKLLKIDVKDCELQAMFDTAPLSKQCEKLVLSQWTTGDWLLTVSDKIKTLIGKIRYVYLTQSRMKEMYVDGFMDSMLHILSFDDYPCFMYPQYEYSTTIGEDNRITAISDFGIVSESHKMLIVIEDKTMNNASYSNNWKEDQILGELFVAVHNTVETTSGIQYPLHIYAIRVVGTLFTFYRAIGTLDYIKESSRETGGLLADFLNTSLHTEDLQNTSRWSVSETSMVVQRHPAVLDDPSQLTAYDFCVAEQRLIILKCMTAIKQFVSED